MNAQENTFFASVTSGSRRDHAEGRLKTPYLDALQAYPTHGLSDLKDASLMDRIDTKFLISVQHLPFILRELQPYYSALEIAGKRLFIYHNTYFDTADYQFYHSHHQGKLSRYKVRHRHYVDNRLGFLEVKLKTNKGRTIKTRIPQSEPSLDSVEVSSFLISELKDQCQDLQPAQWGSYQRISLANEASGERITLDLNLNFHPIEDVSNPAPCINLPNLLIAELKQSRQNLDSPFVHLMSRLGIRPKSFSKYCIGCLMVTPGLKANRFKPQLITLTKLHDRRATC